MVNTMATGLTPNYDIPYPLSSDPVDVHGDIQSLAETVESLLGVVGPAFQTLDVKNVSGSSISKGDPVFISGYSVSKPTVAKCDSDDLTTFPVLGLATTSIANSSDGVVLLSGVFSNINTNSYNVGDKLYVSSSGGLTITQPTTGSGVVGVVLKKNASTGIILVGQPKGNGSWGSLKAGLS
jgi:predicted RecA/RadA family phage recombinase